MRKPPSGVATTVSVQSCPAGAATAARRPAAGGGRLGRLALVAAGERRARGRRRPSGNRYACSQAPVRLSAAACVSAARRRAAAASAAQLEPSTARAVDEEGGRAADLARAPRLARSSRRASPARRGCRGRRRRRRARARRSRAGRRRWRSRRSAACRAAGVSPAGRLHRRRRPRGSHSLLRGEQPLDRGEIAARPGAAREQRGGEIGPVAHRVAQFEADEAAPDIVAPQRRHRPRPRRPRNASR